MNVKKILFGLSMILTMLVACDTSYLVQPVITDLAEEALVRDSA